MSFKICGILENLVYFVRYAWGSCWFDIDISIYTRQNFINLLSVQRRCIHLFENVKKNAKLWDFNMNILLSKFAGSSKIWLIVCGTHGGVIGSTWISQYIHIKFL